MFAVPEDKLGLMRPGSAVEVRIWPGQTQLGGRVREVSASADPVTRTYQVKVALEGRQPPPLGATVSVLPKLKNGDACCSYQAADQRAAPGRPGDGRLGAGPQGP